MIDKTEIIKVLEKVEVAPLFSEREKEIIYYRFGFKNGVGHTLEETGEKFNITKQRVHQIIDIVLKEVEKK